MDGCIRIVTLAAVAAVLSGSSAPVTSHQQPRSLAALAREMHSIGTEQEWIVGEIVGGIERGVSRSRSTRS